MAKIIRLLSKKAAPSGLTEIVLRVRLTANNDFRVKSGIFIPAEHFSSKTGALTPPRRDPAVADLVREAERKLQALEAAILGYLADKDPGAVKSENVYTDVMGRSVKQKSPTLHFTLYSNDDKGRSVNQKSPTLHFTLYSGTDAPSPFFAALDKHVADAHLAPGSVKIFRRLADVLHRFELYKRKNAPAFALDVATFDADTIRELRLFMADERPAFDAYPDIYDAFPYGGKKRDTRPGPRANNTCATLEKRLASFFNGQVKAAALTRSPFSNLTRLRESYDTPWMLTYEELEAVRRLPLDDAPALAVQRDVFVFQCYVGCRVADLADLTTANIDDGVLTYKPHKTDGKTATMPRVQLLPEALEILGRYNPAHHRGRLLPCITPQAYGRAIKEILRRAGIMRNVLVREKGSGEAVMRPLCDVGASHLARRTFINLVYRAVKDPNIVATMTGHVEGSRAFARYRQIDDDIRREAIYGAFHKNDKD